MLTIIRGLLLVYCSKWPSPMPTESVDEVISPRFLLSIHQRELDYEKLLLLNLKNIIMKKIFILLLVALFANVSKAQGYQSEVNINYDLGVDDDKNSSFGAKYIGGYRFNNNFRLGAGVGISYIDLKYEDAYVSSKLNYYDEYRESAMNIPVFINAKVNFIGGDRISPFLSMDLGYSIFVPFSKYAERNQLGFFLSPSFGVDFPIGNGALLVQVGYKYQCRKFELDANKGNYSSVSIGLGYQF